MTQTNHGKPATMHAPPWHTEPLEADNGGSIATCNRQRGVVPPLNEDDKPDETTAQRDPCDMPSARRICAAVNACEDIPTEALERGIVRELLAALKQTLEEIEYQHGDMLSPEERSHPRGSGWARVYDKGTRALAQAKAGKERNL